MPKYDYECEDDGVFELAHPMTDRGKRFFCPKCGQWARPVILKAPAAFFLGPGFSSTDGVGRANVGRNPNNQNRYSND